MKTYTETKLGKTFDWNEFLDRAIKGQVSDDEVYRAQELSSNWITCACGHQCDIIPRNKFGAPKDGSLRTLGVWFSHCLTHRKFTEAKETLMRIETRSANIIENINKEEKC